MKSIFLKIFNAIIRFVTNNQIKIRFVVRSVELWSVSLRLWTINPQVLVLRWDYWHSCR